MVCFICNNEIKRYDGHHIYKCAKQKCWYFTKYTLKYEQLRHTFINIPLSEDFFYFYYIVKGFSLPDFKKTFHFNYKQTLFFLKFFNIKKRNIKESCNIDNRYEKYKKTCLEKFGVSNVSQSKIIKQKKKNTFKKNYGVDNIFKTVSFSNFVEKRMIEIYGVKSLSNRYGNLNLYWANMPKEQKKKRMEKLQRGFRKWFDNLTEEQKDTIIAEKSKRFMPKYQSNLENRIAKSLDRLNIKYIRQFWISRKSYDFLIKDSQVLVEVNGDFWHANPECYQPNDILNHSNKIKASEIWKKDKAKKDIAEKYNFFVIYVWEKEVNNLIDSELDLFLYRRLADEA